MSDRSYVFRMIGEATSLTASTEGAAAAIDTLGAKTAPANQAVKSLGVSAGQTANAMRQLPAQLTDVVTQLAGGQNPLLILIQQGGQVKDSFGGIGPTFRALTAAISPMVVGIAAGAAAFGTLAFAAYKGRSEQTELTRSLVLTGNAAGVTATSVQAMSQNIAAASGQSVGAVRELAQTFISTGRFGPAALDAVTRAASTLQKASGQTSEEVTKQFEKMTQGATAWSEETNRQYRFLDIATYEQIKALEDHGRAQEAMVLAADTFNKSIEGRVKNLGYWERAWQGVTGGINGTWDALKNVGKDETAGQQVERLQKQLDDRRAGGARRGTGTTADSFETRNAAIQEQLNAAMARRRTEAIAAERQAETARINEAGIAGSKRLTAIELEIDKTQRLNKELAENKRAFDDVNAARKRAGVTPQSQAYLDDIQAKTRKKFEDKSGGRAAKQLDSAYTQRLNALGAENALLDDQIANYAQFGEAVNKSRVAVTLFDVAQGKLTGTNGAALTGLQQYALWERAYDADLKQAALDQEKAAASADKRTRSIEAASVAQALNARDTKIATELAELENSGLAKGSALYAQKAAARTQAVNAEFDAKLAQQLAAQALDTAAEVQRLDDETRALGSSTLARLQAAAAAKLQVQAQKDIAANPGQTAQILDAMVTSQNALTDAITRSYAATREFGSGSAAALQRYREEAGNAAAFADRTVGGGLAKLEDAVVSFAKTGKLSFSSVFEFMYEEYVRNLARMAIASQTKDGSALSGFFAALFGTGGGSNPNYSNEGRNYPASSGGVSVGTSVLPQSAPLGRSSAQSAPSGKGNVYITNNTTAQVSTQRDDNGDLRVLIDQIVDQTHNRVAADVGSGTGRVATAMKSRGVNLNGGIPRRT
jgi:phage-related minor tail protein